MSAGASGVEISTLFEAFRDKWARKTANQIEREIASWRKYMQRHGMAYAWHGKNMTPPNTLADGDKLSALREALELRKAADAAATVEETSMVQMGGAA